MIQTTITLPDNQLLLVDVAVTERERRRGLLGWRSLPQGRGMLFAFEQPGNKSMTMRGMRFPLDVLWIGADKAIKHWLECASSDHDYLLHYPALYVLEIGAWERERLGLRLGDVLRF